jgi:hypothetical protein
MRYVIVNGTAVIRDGVLVRDALPGRAIRRPVATPRGGRRASLLSGRKFRTSPETTASNPPAVPV